MGDCVRLGALNCLTTKQAGQTSEILGPEARHVGFAARLLLSTLVGAETFDGIDVLETEAVKSSLGRAGQNKGEAMLGILEGASARDSRTWILSGRVTVSLHAYARPVSESDSRLCDSAWGRRS